MTESPSTVTIDEADDPAVGEDANRCGRTRQKTLIQTSELQGVGAWLEPRLLLDLVARISEEL